MLIKIPSSNPKLSKYEIIEFDGWQLMEIRNLSEEFEHEVIYTEYAIGFILKGKKILREDKNQITVEEETALFIKRGCYFTSEISLNPHEYKSLVIFFNESHIKEFFLHYKNILQIDSTSSIHSPFTTFPMTNRLQDFITSLKSYLSSPSRYQKQLLNLKMHELLLLCIESDSSNILKSELFKIFSGNKIELIDIMSSYFLKDLPLKELAKLSKRSLTKFKIDFKNEFGTSPYKWIMQRRLEHSQFLLNSTNISVAQVAIEIGYESVSAFIVAFKKKYGKTPKED